MFIYKISQWRPKWDSHMSYVIVAQNVDEVRALAASMADSYGHVQWAADAEVQLYGSYIGSSIHPFAISTSYQERVG